MPERGAVYRRETKAQADWKRYGEEPNWTLVEVGAWAIIVAVVGLAFAAWWYFHAR